MRIWALALSLVLCCSAFGDIIYFKDGKSVECKVIKETPGRIIYTVKGVQHEVARSTVDRIERTSEMVVDVRGNQKSGGTKMECKDKDKGDKDEDGGGDGCVPDPKNYEKGPARGLAAHYYIDPTNWDGHWLEGTHPTVPAKDWTFTQYSHTAIEPHINHQFNHKGWFSIRWQGKLVVGNPSQKNEKEGISRPKEDGGLAEVTFEVWADDGCRLTIDDSTLIDDWKPMWEKAPESHRMAKAMLTTGKHSIVIEYFQGESLKNKDTDPIKLFWESDALKIPHQLIPASHFEHGKLDLLPVKGRLDKENPMPTFKNRLVEKGENNDGDKGGGKGKGKK